MNLLDIVYERRRLIFVYIMLCTAAFILVAFRQLLPTDKRFIFLLWNLFLALVPLVISSILLLFQSQSKSKFTLILMGILWLVFFPNAPYIMTDYIHVFDGDRTFIWLDLITWGYIAGIAFFAALISLNDISNALNKYYSPQTVTLIILVVCLLTGYGIYLGRDLRFNSWDVVTKPHQLIYESINTVRSKNIVYFNWLATSSISLILFGLHYFFYKSGRLSFLVDGKDSVK